MTRIAIAGAAGRMGRNLVIACSEAGDIELTQTLEHDQSPSLGMDSGLLAGLGPNQVLISGGAQEKNRRAGTENVAMIVGLGKAAQIATLEMQQKRHHLLQLREVFESRLAEIPGVIIFGCDAQRLPNTTYFSLPYYHGETLLMELDRAGFALASGSACHSEVTKASHVLTAMGVDEDLALNAVRASFGMNNTLLEVDALVSKLWELIDKLPAIVRRAAV